jgi:glutaconate CoA-transferase subunit A
MPHEYFSDEAHLRRWLELEKDLDAYCRFLDEHVFGVREFSEYLDKCGGSRRLQELRRQEYLL